MDLASIGGTLLGISLIVIAIMTQGSIMAFVSMSSALIVVGGVIAATLINYPLSRVISVMKVVKVAYKADSLEPLEVIRELVRMAEKARKEGLLALENEIDEVSDEFMKKGIQLIVDGTDPELARNILETEISMMEERHRIGAEIFDSMGSSAPAFGMIGTLIGLIFMLKNLNDPSSLGPGMAVALLTTFYGTLLANLLFIPIAGKLKLRSSEEILNREIVIEGILSIQAGENPRIVGEKMKAYLHPLEKTYIDDERKSGNSDEA